MQQSRLSSRTVATFLLALGLASTCSEAALTRDEGLNAAVADFAYIDTSGEPSDQTAVHRKRLQAFMTALRADLERDPALDLLPSSCPPLCNIDDRTPADHFRAAAKAGAKVLVTGGIHKLSTLVQWAKVTAFDVDTNRVLFSKLFTFRGDNDEAWQRAEVFVSREIRAALVTERPAHNEAKEDGEHP